MAADDFIASIRRIFAEEAKCKEDEIRRVEIRIRQQFGGSRVYVGKGVTQGKVQRLADAVAAGVPLKAAFDQAGVSRPAGYRLLARRWKTSTC